MTSENLQQVEGSFEKQVERAKWFKEDLDKGDGWTQRYNVPNEFNSWSKTFPEEEVPIKTLYRFENFPMSVEKFAEMMDPSKMDIRAKWDSAFADLKTLETQPNGAIIAFSRVVMTFPFWDRSVVFHLTPPAEIDWFGKKAFVVLLNDATHASKPAGADGLVRATNGGNFYIAVQDDEEPETKCEVFGLTNNNVNGWMPKTMFESLVGNKASKTFYQLRKSMIEGRDKYFS